MRGNVKLLLMALVMVSCSKEDPYSMRGIDYDYGKEFKHERIVLGRRLENPYRTENITRALQELYPSALLQRGSLVLVRGCAQSCLT